MMAMGGNMVNTGEYIIIAGLFIQLTFFGCFVVVTGLFHRRMTLRPTPESLDPKVRWTRYLTALYVTSGLILTRSLFRVIEYIMGNDGAIMRKEVYMFIFDSVLMLIALVWLNWYHPSEIGLLLRGEKSVEHGLQLILPHRSRSGTFSTNSSDSEM